MMRVKLGFVGATACALAVGSFGYMVIAQPGAVGGWQPSMVDMGSDHGGPVRAALVTGVAGAGITVQDLESSVAFYRDVLGFEKISEREEAGDGIERLTGVFGARRRTAIMRLGTEVLELSDYLAPEGRLVPTGGQSNDRWFQHVAIVVADMDSAYARLREHNVRHASSGPQTLPDWNPNAGGIKAFYFKDPDGHPLELIWFPDGKGDPKWKRVAIDNPAALFLGIDHTAIVVKDTAASLAFYQGTLGMRFAGTSENYGTEQEHLNNVFGARLRITGLRAAHGIGVEFLEYLAPTTGQPYPIDSHANDLWNFQTVLTSSDGDAGQSRLGGAAWVSPGAVDPDGRGDQPTQMFVRDPDGHAVLIRAIKDAWGDQGTPSGANGNEGVPTVGR